MFLNKLWTPIFFASSDDGGAGGGGGAGDDKEKDKGKGAGEKKEYTQAELDAMFGERAKSAKNAAITELLESLGVKTADEIKAGLKKAKDLEDEKLSEADKAKKEAEAAHAEAETAKQTSAAAIAKANGRLMQAEIKSQATSQKFRKEALDDVWLLVQSTPTLLEKLKVNEDGTVEGGEAVVKEIAKTRQHWLDISGGGKGTPRPAARPGDGGQQPVRDKPALHL